MMGELIIHLRSHRDGPGYYFFSKDLMESYGPYQDEKSAKVALFQLMKGDNDPVTDAPVPDVIDFWEDQYQNTVTGEFILPKPTEKQSIIAWEEDLVNDGKTPLERVKIDGVESLYELDGLIDGGYLSFIYGSRKTDFGGWHYVKKKYCRYLMLLDSGGVRKDEYPLYKSRRTERRDQYDYMRETYEQVKIFREQLKNDPTIHTATIDGYEADDIIALLFLKNIGIKSVIAQDKDFFQVPGLREAMTDHHGIPQNHRDLKLPKYAIMPNKPATWVLTQAIFGDKSDTIPRLLPSRSGYKEVYNNTIRNAPNLLSAFWNCYAEFGDQFVTNLRLVLLPHPTLAEEDYDLPNLLFEDLCNGSYWSPDNYNDNILDEVITSIADMEW